MFSYYSCNNPHKKFNKAEEKGNIEAYEDFIENNPNSKYLEDAKHRIRAIKSKVLFVSNRDGNSEIYSIDINGDNPINLSQNPAADYDPKWSPNGRHIAFSSDRTGNREIYIMDYDGINQKQLTVNSGSFPSWSPDGQHIAYCSEFDIFIYDLIDSTFHNITNTFNIMEMQPVWSPCGKYICYSSGKKGETLNLYIMDNTGQNIKQLTNDSAFNYSPTWSPYCQKIIYISSTPLSSFKNPIWVLTEDYNMYVMDEGKGITSICNTENSLAVIDINGSNKDILLSNTNHIRAPYWTQNDELVLVTMDTGDNIDIYSVNIITKDILRLTTTDKQDYSPNSYPVIYK